MVDIHSLIMYNTSFLNNIGDKFGVLSIEIDDAFTDIENTEVKNVVIINSLFVNNSYNTYGGAIYIKNAMIKI